MSETIIRGRQSKLNISLSNWLTDSEVMARKAKAAKEEAGDIERAAQTELLQLQRKFRTIELRREAVPRDCATLINKQKDIINNLEKEKHDLMLDIQVSKSSTNERKNELQEKKISQRIGNLSKTLDQIKLETSQSEELEHQIMKVEKDVMKMRMKDITDIQSKQRAIDTCRNVAILENRLHRVTIKFNEMLTENAELRKQISHLLKERTHFNHLYQQLIIRLNSGKKVMLDLIEQASIAYDQREEAQNKLQVLRERGRQDLLIHSQEMRELQRKLDHDMKLQEFLGVKGQRRVLTDLEAREAWKKQHHREESERLIAKYEGILDQIRDFCGEDDLERLAAHFVKQEEENFALFTYVNELHNELQSLQDDVEELRRKIDDQRALEELRREQQGTKLSNLQDDLYTIRRGMDDADERLEWSSRMMTNMLNGIERLFHLIRCDSSSLLDLLGPNSHATQHNVLLYLSIIERRTNELLNTVFFLQKKADDQEWVEKPPTPVLKDTIPTKLRPVAIEVMTPTQPCILCVEQEEIEAIEEMDDLEMFPFTREEAKQKLLDQLDRPGFEDRLHNVSACRLPRSRRMLQHRFE